MIEDVQKRCWSWEHIDRLVEAQDGQFVCKEHSVEQSRIEDILESLNNIQISIKKYLKAANSKRRHPYEAQALQDIIEDFFTKASPELRAGRGFRFELEQATPQELDIIIDTDSSDWIGRTRDKLQSNPPLAHIEVAYRSMFTLKKFLKDYQRVHETVIAGAALNPPKKVWAAFVGLGPGWEDHREKIVSSIHEYFHERTIQRVSSSNSPDFYDFPDLIAVPGLALIKHRYVDEPGIIRYWPVYVEFPSAINDPAFIFRPLAIARGFFSHFVRGTQFPDSMRERAWPPEDDASIMGPNARINYEEPRTLSLMHAPNDIFAVDFREDSPTRFLHYQPLNTKCSFGKYFRYERRKGSQFDETFLTGNCFD